MTDDTKPTLHEHPFFVGNGSSAGGLEAVTARAQHMSPTHKSLLTALISRETPLPVVELKDDTTPVSNNILITPRNTDVILEDDKLRLVDPSGHPATPKPSAGRLFKSPAR